MANLKMSLALNPYDRYSPLWQGKVSPDGIDLDVDIEANQSPDRHKRMIHELAWDACELSFGTYIMARDRGRLSPPFLSSPGACSASPGCTLTLGVEFQSPKELEGGRVGVGAYQNSLAVLAKGDCQYEYGVSLDKITWVSSREENISFDPPSWLKLERVPSGEDMVKMLAKGELDGVFTPYDVSEVPNVRILFHDHRAQERAYYQRNGYYPIMHTIALRSELVEKEPWVAMSLVNALERARPRPSDTTTTPTGSTVLLTC